MSRVDYCPECGSGIDICRGGQVDFRRFDHGGFNQSRLCAALEAIKCYEGMKEGVTIRVTDLENEIAALRQNNMEQSIEIINLKKYLLEVLQECITDEGACCMLPCADKELLIRRIHAINKICKLAIETT